MNSNKANENVQKLIGFIPSLDSLKICRDLEKHFIDILTTMKIDYLNDPNTKDTPKRIAEMFVYEIFSGRFEGPPNITVFEDHSDYNQLITIGPISVRSMCSHHFMPIYGNAVISILPEKGKLIGLSKFSRIVDYFARRPQIQEAMTRQIADYIVENLNPRALAVKISATHMCMTHRGVKDTNSKMVTTELRGDLKTNKNLRDEFNLESGKLL